MRSTRVLVDCTQKAVPGGQPFQTSASVFKSQVAAEAFGSKMPPMENSVRQRKEATQRCIDEYNRSKDITEVKATLNRFLKGDRVMRNTGGHKDMSFAEESNIMLRRIIDTARVCFRYAFNSGRGSPSAFINSMSS